MRITSEVQDKWLSYLGCREKAYGMEKCERLGRFSPDKNIYYEGVKEQGECTATTVQPPLWA